jgi:XRE family aerobic/anaerobic benzoate catabolism transcriptional regulator
LLHGRGEPDLKRARMALAELFAARTAGAARARRIALIGLRGAGKSTLGRMLAEDLALPFVELTREIERVAGCSVPEIHALYGLPAYRRYERRALEEVIAAHREAVIATPGGLVADPATFNLLLGHCYTVWLQASPEEHMSRVVAQGDLRPMAGNREAMDDLQRILAGREPFYAKADAVCSTSHQPLPRAYQRLRSAIAKAMGQSRA